MAKSCLNLSKVTSSTQNADLLEALLLAFEEKVQRSKETSGVSSLLANQLSSSTCTSSSSESPQSFPRPVVTSTPRSRTSLAFDDPVSESPESSSHSETEFSPYPVFRRQNFQISTQATQDDPIYFASEGALRSLFSFFTAKLKAKCCFCGKEYDAESISFRRQGHAVSVNMSCLCGDSIKWLSSPIMGGPTPKYYVNMRYVDIVHFTVYVLSLFWSKPPTKFSSLNNNNNFSVYVVEWFMGFWPVAWQKPNILVSVKLHILAQRVKKLLTQVGLSFCWLQNIHTATCTVH